MIITVINPNRIDACTAVIDHHVRQWFPDVDVRVVSPTFGPAELTGEYEAALCVAGVLDGIATTASTSDGYVLAGFGEPGSEAAREYARRPVVDITEAGPIRALLHGRRYAVVTSTTAAVPLVEDRLRCLGFDGRCRAVRAIEMGVPDMIDDRERAREAIDQQVKALVADGHSGAVVLGCGGMTGLADEIDPPPGIVLVDAVRVGISLAIGMITDDPRAQHNTAQPIPRSGEAP